MQEVYILGESPTRDGLNLTQICKDKTSLLELAKRSFEDRFDKEDNLIIHSIKSNDTGDIEIIFSNDFSGGAKVVCTQYYYIKKPLI